jgi:conjugative transfer pilus assembly protein TraH
MVNFKGVFMKKIGLFFIFSFVQFFLYIPSAKADLSSEMNKFWNNLGGSTNSNSAYMGQSAGYYTGGSLHTRAPVMQQNLFNMQTPKITAGCGGIDIFTGSFSHINADQFVAQLKAIGANSLGYAFQLGFQTLSPMLKSVTDKIQEAADWANNLNINSCETAKSIVGSPRETFLSLKESGCSAISLITGSASDADAARNRCKSSSVQKTENDKLPDEEKMTDINFVWQTMRTAGYIDALGTESAEAFMSMVGTIILKDGEHARAIPPLALDITSTRALIDGGEIKVKKCDETIKCLNLSDKTLTFNETNAYKPKIKMLLQSMEDKIRNNSDSLTDTELALVGKTSIPIFRTLVNNASGARVVNNDILAEIVARDMMNKFLEDIASAIRMKLTELKLINNNRDMVDILSSNINIVERYLTREDENLKNDFKQILDIIETNEKFDRKLASSFSGHIKSVLDFSNSLEGGIK